MILRRNSTLRSRGVAHWRWHNPAATRMHAVDRRGHSVQKLSAETDTALLVPSYCCRRLRRGGIAELDRLHRSRMSFSIRRSPIPKARGESRRTQSPDPCGAFVARRAENVSEPPETTGRAHAES